MSVPRHLLCGQLSGCLGWRPRVLRSILWASGVSSNLSRVRSKQKTIPLHFSVEWFVLKASGEGFALPWLLWPGRCCPAIAHPGNRSTRPLRLPGHIQRVPVLTVPQSAITYAPPSLGTPNSYRLSAQESHIPGLPCRCPLGTARARALVPLDGRWVFREYWISEWAPFPFPQWSSLCCPWEARRLLIERRVCSGGDGPRTAQPVWLVPPPVAEVAS